jgi:hypothetical protein
MLDVENGAMREVVGTVVARRFGAETCRKSLDLANGGANPDAGSRVCAYRSRQLKKGLTSQL